MTLLQGRLKTARAGSATARRSHYSLSFKRLGGLGQSRKTRTREVEQRAARSPLSVAPSGDSPVSGGSGSTRWCGGGRRGSGMGRRARAPEGGGGRGWHSGIDNGNRRSGTSRSS